MPLPAKRNTESEITKICRHVQDFIALVGAEHVGDLIQYLIDGLDEVDGDPDLEDTDFPELDPDLLEGG